MKLLLIDLDNTLIDLSGFKTYLFTQLETSYHIPEAKSTFVYNSVKKKDFWPNLLIDKLHQDYQVPKSDLNSLFDTCFSKIVPMKKQIEYLRNFDGKKYILSFGTYDLQMKKIRQFGFETLVDGIFITLENKLEFLAKMIENDTVIIDAVAFSEVTLVDNDLDFLTNLKNEYPWIEARYVTDIV